MMSTGSRTRYAQHHAIYKTPRTLLPRELLGRLVCGGPIYRSNLIATELVGPY